MKGRPVHLLNASIQEKNKREEKDVFREAPATYALKLHRLSAILAILIADAPIANCGEAAMSRLECADPEGLKLRALISPRSADPNTTACRSNTIGRP